MDTPVDLWNGLPQDIGYIVVEFVSDVDSYGYLNCVCHNWQIKPDEFAYQRMCTHIYTKQSIKKSINFEKWGCARTMLILRPRLRTNGFYSLRTTYSKPPVNDAFWEEKKREFNEVKFYRHFRFFNDGKVLYSLGIKDPRTISSDMNTIKESNPSKRMYMGSYILRRDTVIVDVDVDYAMIHFVLVVRNLCGDEEGGHDEQYAGNHNLLKLVEHSSRPHAAEMEVGGTSLN